MADKKSVRADIVKSIASESDDGSFFDTRVGRVVKLFGVPIAVGLLGGKLGGKLARMKGKHYPTSAHADHVMLGFSAGAGVGGAAAIKSDIDRYGRGGKRKKERPRK